MKTKKKFSLNKYIIIQFIIYTCIIFLFVVLINLYNSWKLNNSFLVIDDFLEYESMLEYENYGSIPMSKFPGCDFAIYDEDNELIYATNSDIALNIDGSDLEFINDYSSNYYYDVLNVVDKKNNKIIKIYKTMYDNNMDEDVVVASSVLNSDLEVESGTLFQKKDTLTDRELDLLKGYYSDEQMVEKYEFKTIDKEKNRTLLFMSPSFTSSSYDDIVKSNEMTWLIAIPFLMLIIFGETYFFNKKLKKSLNSLNNVINSYKYGEKIEEELPKEFESVLNSFTNLMEQLKVSEAEKINIYKDKQRIIADLSHDLKTPLTVIGGYSKAFLDDLVPSDKQKQYIETIYKKSMVATSSIDSLFLYANMAHPEYKLNKDYIDIVKYTRDYLALKYNEIEISKMSLEVNIKIDKCMVYIDQKEFRRIYENLIDNSIKYNKSGTKIYFEMGIDEYLYIIIGDNGIGIDNSLGDKVFDAFVTSNEARTSGNGTGLGLSIVKNLVEMHDGSITLVKKCKKGLKTEFLIKIKI